VYGDSTKSREPLNYQFIVFLISNIRFLLTTRHKGRNLEYE